MNDKELEDLRNLIAERDVGLECGKFLESTVGRYLLGRVSIYEKENYAALRQVSASDTMGIIDLQSKSRIPGLIVQWLVEAINDGEKADFQLKEHYDEEEEK